MSARPAPPCGTISLVRALLVAVLCVAGPAGPSRAALQAPSAEERTPLAVFELAAPAARRFVLRATVPLPAGAWPDPAGELPFGVVSHDEARTIVPAQLEVVTRSAAGDVEVAEVLALVERAEDEAPGARIRYALVHAPHARRPPPRPSERLAPLLRAGIVLRASDVYGNRYEAELLGRRRGPGFGGNTRLASGGAHLRQRVVATQVPVGEPSPRGPPLPHLLSVHAYLGLDANSDVLSLDLRIHNGASAGLRRAQPVERPLGLVYFRELELVVPKGFVVVPTVADPFFGPARVEGDARVVPLVRANEDGALHLMPPQGQMQRRLAIAPAGEADAARRRLAREGLAFCVRSLERWSWANPKTARYFPQRDLVGSLDFVSYGGTSGKGALRRRARAELARLRGLLEKGEPGDYPAVSGAMGWAHPWFVHHEAGYGGEDVVVLEGQRAIAGASQAEVVRLGLLARMNACRMPVAMWNARGEPAGFEAWRNEKGGLDFDFRTHGRGVPPCFRLPCRGGPPASEQVREVVRRGLRPAWDRSSAWRADGSLPSDSSDLLAWVPHDGAHLVRWTKNLKALVWLANDPLAKDDLWLEAERFHMYFHEGPTPNPPDWLVALSEFERLVAAHPGKGAPLNRDHAWGIDAFAAFWSMADDEWRARYRAWAERVADLLVRAATPCGIISRSGSGPLFGGTPYEGSHAFQSELLTIALRSLAESVFRGVDEGRRAALEDVLVRATEYLFFDAPFVRERESWSSPEDPVWTQGPIWGFAVGFRDDWETPPFCDTTRWGPNYLPPDGVRHGVETFYGWALLAYAADATQASAGAGLKNRYLRRGLDYGHPKRSWKELWREMVRNASQPEYDPTPNATGYLARLQLFGAR